MIIDFHTHMFPDKIAARAVEALKAGIIKQQGPVEIPSYTDATYGNTLQHIREEKVDRIVVLPIVTRPSQLDSILRFGAEINSGDPAIRSFASVFPDESTTPEVLDRIKDMGFRGIKLHPEFQNANIDDPVTLKILEGCEKRGLYTVFHAGEDIGYPLPCHASPKQIRNTLDYVSGKYLIAAHLGGWRMWDEVEQYLMDTEVSLDTAFVAGWIDPAQYKRIIRTHGADKIIFGSDLPWQTAYQSYQGLKVLDLTQEEMDQICYKNALRILGESDEA